MLATIHSAHLTGVKADAGKAVLRISFEVALSNYSFEDATEDLQKFLDKDHNEVEVVITPRQLPLPEKKKAGE
jgi:hypothetical protein